MARESAYDHRTHSRRHGSGYGDRRHRHRSSHASSSNRSSYRTDGGLSQEKLASLNEQLGWSAPRAVRRDESHRWGERPVYAEKVGREHRRQRNVSDDFYYRNERPRVASGAPLVPVHEHTQRSSSRRRSRRHYDREAERREHRKRRRRRWLIVAIVASIIVIIVIGVAAGLSAKKRRDNDDGDDAKPSNANLDNIEESSIPDSVKGTYMDPFTWYDTSDFNITYTSELIGGLSPMGINTSYSDSVRANPTVPPLDEPWPYGTRPIRGVNVGGWLYVEPFITPSIFSKSYPSSDLSTSAPADLKPPYKDEYTLTSALTPSAASALLDKHYSTFITRQSFASIRAAGFDHVRIPYPYWAVTTYPSDPYVPHVAWRHLLRGIEYARLNGLRVKLDLHSVPGSQNGWNHSGRQGAIRWLAETDEGARNAERTLEIHDQLAKFFGQPRYRNVVTMYGLVNEPNMQLINADRVLNWTDTALLQLRASALPSTTVLVISNGFLPLPFFQSALSSSFPTPQSRSRILLDAHQYTIFNPDTLSLNHSAKLDYACSGWRQQARQSMDPAKGFGSFLCGEWSQADTDCVRWLNNVGVGARWDGTLDTGDPRSSVLTPVCAAANKDKEVCDCGKANADPREYDNAYRKWLRAYAEAQMGSFAVGWGSFYWTWEIEEGVKGGEQMSWRRGVEAGILPRDVSELGQAGMYDCEKGDESEWEGLGEGY